MYILLPFIGLFTVLLCWGQLIAKPCDTRELGITSELREAPGDPTSRRSLLLRGGVRSHIFLRGTPSLHGARVQAQPQQWGDTIELCGYHSQGTQCVCRQEGWTPLLWVQETEASLPLAAGGLRSSGACFWGSGVSGWTVCSEIFHSYFPGASPVSGVHSPGWALDGGRGCIFWVFSLLGRIRLDMALEQPLPPGDKQWLVCDPGLGDPWQSALPATHRKDGPALTTTVSRKVPQPTANEGQRRAP